MEWNINPNKNTSDFIENLAYPPSGGRVKLVIFGVFLPLIICYFTAKAWITQEAIWFGTRGWSMTVTGKTAQSMATCYFGVAGFCHFRWFWGLIPSYRVFYVGVIISMIIGLGGCGAAFYYAY